MGDDRGSTACGPRSTACGRRTTACERRSVACGPGSTRYRRDSHACQPQSTRCGPRSTRYGPRSTRCRPRTTRRRGIADRGVRPVCSHRAPDRPQPASRLRPLVPLRMARAPKTMRRRTSPCLAIRLPHLTAGTPPVALPATDATAMMDHVVSDPFVGEGRRLCGAVLFLDDGGGELRRLQSRARRGRRRCERRGDGYDFADSGRRRRRERRFR
jgi:hypothetical protein